MTCESRPGKVPPYEYQPKIEWINTGGKNKDGIEIWKLLIPCIPSAQPTPDEYAELCPTAAHGQPPCQIKFTEIEQPAQSWELVRAGNVDAGILPIYNFHYPVALKNQDATHVLHQATYGCQMEPEMLYVGRQYYEGTYQAMEAEINDDAPQQCEIASGRILGLQQVRYEDNYANKCPVYVTIFQDLAGVDLMGKPQVYDVARVDKVGADPLIVKTIKDNSGQHAALSYDQKRFFVVRQQQVIGKDNVFAVVFDFDEETRAWTQNAELSGEVSWQDEFAFIGAIVVNRHGEIGTFYNQEENYIDDSSSCTDTGTPPNQIVSQSFVQGWTTTQQIKKFDIENQNFIGYSAVSEGCGISNGDFAWFTSSGNALRGHSSGDFSCIYNDDGAGARNSEAQKMTTATDSNNKTYRIAGKNVGRYELDHVGNAGRIMTCNVNNEEGFHPTPIDTICGSGTGSYIADVKRLTSSYTLRISNDTVSISGAAAVSNSDWAQENYNYLDDHLAGLDRPICTGGWAIGCKCIGAVGGWAWHSFCGGIGERTETAETGRNVTHPFQHSLGDKSLSGVFDIYDEITGIRVSGLLIDGEWVIQGAPAQPEIINSLDAIYFNVTR